MGTKYSSQTASGYNATPPADDGTVSEANKVKYSTVKTKLSDPVKTLSDAINTALETHFDNGPVATATNLTLLASHYGQVIEASGATTTLTLSDANTLTAGWWCEVRNTGAANVTITGATTSDTFNGTAFSSSTYSLKIGEAFKIVVNAAATGFITTNSFVALDTTFTVQGSSDGTKKIRFEVDGLTTANTRVITPPDVDVTLPYKPGTYGGSQVYTSSDTWTKPAGLKRVRVIVTAGGGGGGGCAQAGNAGAGGGGAGATSIDTIEAADLGATETVTVGAAGAGGTAGNNAGSTGGTSSFGTHCACAGGAGGAAGNTGTAGLGGAVSTAGDIDFNGGPGHHGNTAAGVNGLGGNGGASYYGGGGLGAQNTGNGAAGLAYGSGGAGSADNNTANRSGGAGKAGIVIVEEYF